MFRRNSYGQGIEVLWVESMQIHDVHRAYGKENNDGFNESKHTDAGQNQQDSDVYVRLPVFIFIEQNCTT